MKISISTLLFLFSASAFAPIEPLQRARTIRSACCTGSGSTLLSMVVDPVTVGGFALSAVAGALTQLPRIQKLEADLCIARDEVAATEQELIGKIDVLEDKLFAMDDEFEQQTAKFQRQYDQTQRQKMEAFKEKLKTEMKYKLEILAQRQQSDKLINEILPVENSRTSRQQELSELRLQQDELQSLNAKLEQAVANAEIELQRFRQAASAKKKFFFF